MKLKLLLSLTLLLVISSCGHNKIRKVRVNDNRTPSLSKLKKDSQKPEEKTIIATEEYIVQNNEIESIEIEAGIEPLSNDDHFADAELSEEFQPQDSTVVKPSVSQEALYKSKETEENAKYATLFFILSFPALFFGPLGLVFYIIGNRKYKKAKKAQFTTPKGEDLERKAKLTKIIVTSIFLGLMLAGAIALLFSEPAFSFLILGCGLLIVGIVALFSNIFL